MRKSQTSAAIAADNASVESMATMSAPSNLHGFDLVKEEFVPEYNAKGFLFKHKKTGAEVMSLSTPPTNQPPSPSTPLAENEPPQTASRDWTAPRPACEPAIRRNDSGLQPKVGINSLTGKIELTRVGRQASHTTDGIRRQLSLLFADEPDEIAAAPTSSAIWRHDHFGMPPVGAV